MFTINVFGYVIDRLECAPWGACSGRNVVENSGSPLYTPEQRRRRDASPWTFVQGVLAPAQFAVFVISLGFVLHFLLTGRGLTAATASVVVKTLVLYTIMVTGSLWERDVFGKYLFAPAFFWEDVVSMAVIALHTLYLVALFAGNVDPQRLMIIALAAYSSYVINAVQFVLKLRAARLQMRNWTDASDAGLSHGELGYSK
jgi:3-vinyl bacteriochlorophyllide hydratase